MSTALSWQKTLRRTLEHLKKAEQPARVAVVGIGHELHGDDAVGVALARMLKMRVPERESLLVIEAGPMPENSSGTLRRFGPDLVLLIDAAQMDVEPGTVRWLAWQPVTGNIVSTHTLPLTLFARYLTAELGCEVALIGIQPADLAFGAALSPTVREAAEATAEILADVLQGQETGPRRRERGPAREIHTGVAKENGAKQL
jgi:hydrogenase 3 maturation protease